MKSLIKVLIVTLVSIGLLLSMVVGCLLLFVDNEDDSSSGTEYGNVGLSAEVLAYKPLVERYCSEYGISDYVIYILAIMQVESSGKGMDVMQCSESLGLPLNSLMPEASIKQGCYYFSSLLTTANKLGCDINTIIQSYNYGGGFVLYVSQRGNNYTFALAMSFANTKASGRTVTYTNAIAVATNGGWRYAYGNMFYLMLVNQYLGTADGDFIWPSDVSYRVTSVYGDRIHPISGVNRHHNGIDIGAAHGTNVLASASGTVTLSSYYGGYGNCIIIEHANGYKTLYGHMSQLKVSVGSTVVQGQVIGLVGSTGNSTGPHIHFEVWKDGSRTDPLDYFPESLYTYS